MTLNLGAGRKHLPGVVNVDIVADTDPDVVHDLNQRPWPFEADAFDEVLAFDVIEHLDDVVRTLEEIHRVGRAGARVRITVPHFSCANAFRDVTHRHFFSVSSLDYFTGGHELNFYSKCRYELVAAQIVFRPTLLNKLVWRCAARWPEAYEQRWAWIFPAWFLSFELRVLKS